MAKESTTYITEKPASICIRSWDPEIPICRATTMELYIRYIQRGPHQYYLTSEYEPRI